MSNTIQRKEFLISQDLILDHADNLLKSAENSHKSFMGKSFYNKNERLVIKNLVDTFEHSVKSIEKISNAKDFKADEVEKAAIKLQAVEKKLEAIEKQHNLHKGNFILSFFVGIAKTLFKWHEPFSADWKNNRLKGQLETVVGTVTFGKKKKDEAAS